MNVVMLLSNAFRPDPRVYKEALSMSAYGHRVTIVCWDRGAELPAQEKLAENAEVIRVQNVPSAYGIGARQMLKLPAFWREALRWVERIQPDIVHCHDFDTLPAGLAWAKLHRRPVIYDAHEYYAELCRPRLAGWGGKLIYHGIKLAELAAARWVDWIVTVDQNLAEIYRRRNRHVTVIGHYPPRTFIDEERRIFAAQQLTLVYAGRLSTDRGALYYVRLLRTLLQLGVPAELKLVGLFVPAAEEQAFWQEAQGLEQHIQALGWIPFEQVADILRTGDVGLAVLSPEPRYVASVPVKLFEYMALGMLVIASDFPSIREIMESSPCGVLVDPLQDPLAAARLLVDYWARPEEAQRLGNQGRQAVKTRYNWEKLMEYLDGIYRDIGPK